MFLRYNTTIPIQIQTLSPPRGRGTAGEDNDERYQNLARSIHHAWAGGADGLACSAASASSSRRPRGIRLADGSFQRVHDILEAAVTHHPLAPLRHDEAHRFVAPRRLYCTVCIVVLDAQKIDQSWSI